METVLILKIAIIAACVILYLYVGIKMGFGQNSVIKDYQIYKKERRKIVVAINYCQGVIMMIFWLSWVIFALIFAVVVGSCSSSELMFDDFGF